jgi:hypothetical protein
MTVYDVCSSPLVAIAWESPWLLGWCAAAVAPLLIHLLSRRRYQTAPWAAMDFLLAAARRQSRRIRIEHWLLLALRTAIILVFVAAIANPYTDAQHSVAPAARRMHTLFVLDASFSMGQQSAGQTPFQAAKDLIARHVGDDVHRADAFSLVLMGVPARAIVKGPTADRAAFLEAIAAVELPHGRADALGALGIARDLIAQGPAAWPALTDQQVVILTDMARNTWGRETALGAANPVQQALVDLSGAAEVRIVDLGFTTTTNAAITNLATAENLLLAGAEANISATVQSYATAALDDLSVELLIAGRRVDEKRLKIDQPRGLARVDFTYRFAAAGNQVIEARLKSAGDMAPIDNHRWRSVQIREHLRTLCIAGKPGAADYVRAAAATGPRGTAGFEAQIAAPDFLRGAAALTPFDVIVLCNVPALGGDEVRALEKFHRRGGGLVWFLGDQVAADAYQRAMPVETELFPATLDQPSVGAKYAIDPMGYEHPILRPYQGQQDSTLADTPIHVYWKMRPRAGTVDSSATPGVGAAVATPFLKVSPSRDDLAVAASSARGRVVVFATDGSLASIDPKSGQPWTYWPVWQSFVPIVQETIRFVAGGEQTRLNTIVGLPLTGELPNAAPNVRVEVQLPRGDRAQREEKSAISQTAVVSTHGSQMRWSFAETNRSGVYRVTSNAAGAAAEAFAVNVDTDESDLTRVARDELPASVQVLAGDVGAAADSNLSSVRRSDWQAPLLYVLLALVVAESACAWLLGRRLA